MSAPYLNNQRNVVSILNIQFSDTIARAAVGTIVRRPSTSLRRKLVWAAGGNGYWFLYFLIVFVVILDNFLPRTCENGGELCRGPRHTPARMILGHATASKAPLAFLKIVVKIGTI